MRVAVIGSRGLEIENIGDYLPENTTEIVSGGAKGVDGCARDYALKNNLKYTEFLPHYSVYGKVAPLKRNIEIICYSDMILGFGTENQEEQNLLLKTAKNIVNLIKL